MKVLFVVEDYIIDPLGVGYLSAYLKDAGHDVGIYKTNEPISKVIDYRPDILAYSVTTGKHIFYRDLNLSIRAQLDYTPISIFGGAHITFFPQFCMEEGIDYGVRGEGFEAIVDIANWMDHDVDIATIPNVVHKDSIQPLRPLIDKSTLLHPDRELIYSYPKNYNNPIKNVMCSFGCPANCPYCYNERYKKMYGLHKAEIRPVDEVISEVEELQAYPLDLIFFQDDIFPLYNTDWLDEFVSKYQGPPFHIQTRVEMITRERIERLKAVGLDSLTFAIESGNEALRNEILKRKMSDNYILESAALLHNLNIKFRTENMIGIPYETWETALQTLDMSIACKPTIGWASLFQPYPGTITGDICREEGWFDGNIDDISGTFFDTYKLDVPNARRYEKLQKIFTVIVNHPELRPYVEILCDQKLEALYGEIYKLYKNMLYGKLYRLGE